MIHPYSHEGYDLFRKGSIALARMEHNGMCVNVGYLRKQAKVLTEELLIAEKKLLSTEEGKLLKAKYGTTAVSLRSNEQLAWLFYRKMGESPAEDGSKKVDELALMRIGTPFCRELLNYRGKYKAKNTYIDNIVRQAVKHDDGMYRIHPSFSLITASSFRSSSFEPNLQNIPIRKKGVGELIRKAFIPSKGNVLIEVDYSGAEVHCSVCYHKDSSMIRYLEDPSTDMHRDTASDIFKCSSSLISKPIRQLTKTFVFGEFYGDWYVHQAIVMWDALHRDRPKMENGVDALKHLRNKGIRNLNDFSEHMRLVEEELWQSRFVEYNEWRNKTWEQYVQEGGYTTLTGFQLGIGLNRKQVTNFPIQGSAFHWLLWSLTVCEDWARKKGLKARPVGQIHDSMIWDAPVEEVDVLTEKLNKTMTKDIYKKYDWIQTKLEAEIDITEKNKSWFTKKPITV